MNVKLNLKMLEVIFQCLSIDPEYVVVHDSQTSTSCLKVLAQILVGSVEYAVDKCEHVINLFVAVHEEAICLPGDSRCCWHFHYQADNQSNPFQKLSILGCGNVYQGTR